MPPPVQIANLPITAPKVGENGYQGFQPGKEEVLPEGWNGFNSRALSCDILVQHDVGIRVRDGCTLYCDIYRPPGADKVPAIVCWSPFGKKFNGIGMMKNVMWGCGVPDGCLSGLERFEGVDPAEFVPRGFAVVNVDARGAGDSDGSIVIMGTQEAEDGHDVIEALAKMDWCNGSIGLAGNSHLAIVQWFIAATQPPSLKAIAPWEACGDLYREQFVRGGLWNKGLFDLITRMVIRGRNGLEDFEEMHRRSSVMNAYWEDKRPDLTKTNIPTYIVASYSSFVHTMGSIRGWLEIPSSEKWLRWDPYQEWYDLWAVEESRDELARFFGKYLRGDDNGWEKTPKFRNAILRFGEKEPIQDIVEETFPIPRTRYLEYFFQADGTLSDKPSPSTALMSYRSEWTVPNGREYVSFVHTFQETTTLCGLPKAVVYMSCPDHDDMNIFVAIRKLDKTGKPMLNVNIPWHRVPFKTIDAIPTNQYSNLTIYHGPMGILRASHREIDSSRSIHPQYPFHTHREEQRVPPGTVVELEIGLWAMGIEFEAGESLRVEVSGQYPFHQEFNEAVTTLEREMNKGVHQLHVGGQYPSRIVLPFI
jgi:predicted acyl esterase